MAVKTTHKDEREHRRQIAQELNRLESKLSPYWVLVAATTYTVDDYDVILVDDDTAAGAVTITLPTAENGEGRPVRVKKLGTTGSVIIDGAGSETIDGAATKTLTTQYESTQLISDGTSWHAF